MSAPHKYTSTDCVFQYEHGEAPSQGHPGKARGLPDTLEAQILLQRFGSQIEPLLPPGADPTSGTPIESSSEANAPPKHPSSTSTGALAGGSLPVTQGADNSVVPDSEARSQSHPEHSTA